MQANRKAISILTALLIWLTTSATSAENLAADDFKNAFNLQEHSEGGWFAEIYTAPFKQKNRATAGSIYFLLDKDDISHFHQLDCDEIWYYHAGCGIKIIMLQDGQIKEFLLGIDTEHNEQPMIVLPAGAIFAAENIDKNSYTFISCATTPRFDYKGFRLITKAELKKFYPDLPEELLKMAYEKV